VLFVKEVCLREVVRFREEAIESSSGCQMPKKLASEDSLGWWKLLNF